MLLFLSILFIYIKLRFSAGSRVIPICEGARVILMDSIVYDVKMVRKKQNANRRKRNLNYDNFT